MKLGALYQTKEYFWLIFPSKEIAATTIGTFPDEPAFGAGDAAWQASYWSKVRNCNVSYIEPNSIFVLLDQDGEYCKVLSTEGNVGWIVYRENEDCIKEVNQ